MTLGIKEQINKISSYLNEASRFIDVSVQIVQYEKSVIGLDPIPTGRRSKVYGGKYDVYKREFIGPADKIHEIECYGDQFDFILNDENFFLELVGGRGSGKSVAGAIKAIVKMISNPSDVGFILAPSYDHAKRVRERIINRIPEEWIYQDFWMPDKKELILITGARIRYKSATQDKRLRSDSGNWGFGDECQILKTSDVDSFVPCLREGQSPQYYECGTINKSLLERHKRNLELESKSKAKCYTLNPLDNPWVNDEIQELASSLLSTIAYRIEILSDWDALIDDDKPLVFPTLNNKHLVNVDSIGWKDITRLITARKTKKSFDYVVGVDFNNAWANAAVIHKVYHPDILIATHQIYKLGNASHLADEMKIQGYTPQNTLIIADKSGAKIGTYNIAGGARAPIDRLIAAGYTVLGANKGGRNPDIIDTVDSLMAKIDPVNGSYTFFISNRLSGEDLFEDSRGRSYNGLFDDFKELEWRGDKLLKSQNKDITHSVDCSRYVCYYLFPAPKKKHNNQVYAYDANGIAKKL